MVESMLAKLALPPGLEGVSPESAGGRDVAPHTPKPQPGTSRLPSRTSPSPPASAMQASCALRVQALRRWADGSVYRGLMQAAAHTDEAVSTAACSHPVVVHGST